MDGSWAELYWVRVWVLDKQMLYSLYCVFICRFYRSPGLRSRCMCSLLYSFPRLRRPWMSLAIEIVPEIEMTKGWTLCKTILFSNLRHTGLGLGLKHLIFSPSFIIIVVGLFTSWTYCNYTLECDFWCCNIYMYIYLIRLLTFRIILTIYWLINI